jgi:quercetin dioxygenase-like cupin family protein
MGSGLLRVALALAVAGLAGCPKKSTTGGGTGGATGAGGGDGDVAVDETERKQLAAIEAAINAHGIAVHTCWSMAAADDYRVAGQVLLRLTLGDGGAVAGVAIEGDSVEDPVLTECLAEMWKASEWPADLFAAGDQIRLPPFEFVAPTGGQNVVNARHALLYPIGADKKSGASILLDYKNSGNSAGALTLLTLEPGFQAPLHRHTSAEVLYVLSGTGTLRGHRRGNKPQEVKAGTAIYIPAGAPHGFDAGAERVVALQLYAPGGPEQRFKGVDVGGTSPVARRGRRDPEAAVRAHAEVKTYEIAGGKGTASLLFDAESAPDNAASIGGLTLQAKTAIPIHVHANATEILFIIEGGGTMTVAGQAREVGRLDAIQIPPGVEHAFVAGAETVKAVQLYTPSGPEQRFKNK